MGSRHIPLSREIYIDRADFRESANRKYKRLVIEGEVRLRNAYVIKCESVIKDDEGEIIELRCSYDEDTLGVNPVGRKVRGVIHWVSASHAVKAEVRLYDRLFTIPAPDGSKNENFLDYVNPDSLEIIKGAMVEPSLKDAKKGDRFQFEREGYFNIENTASDIDGLVFNRIVPLRDSWARIEQRASSNK